MKYPIEGKIQREVNSFEKGKWYTCIHSENYGLFTPGKSYMCVIDNKGTLSLVTKTYFVHSCKSLCSKFTEHLD